MLSAFCSNPMSPPYSSHRTPLTPFSVPLIAALPEPKPQLGKTRSHANHNCGQVDIALTAAAICYTSDRKIPGSIDSEIRWKACFNQFT